MGDKMNGEENKESAGFFRRRLNHLINYTRKHPALFKIVLFFLDLRIRRPMIRFVYLNYDGDLIGVEIGT
jgi:hypothetical protein